MLLKCVTAVNFNARVLAGRFECMSSGTREWVAEREIKQTESLACG